MAKKIICACKTCSGTKSWLVTAHQKEVPSSVKEETIVTMYFVKDELCLVGGFDFPINHDLITSLSQLALSTLLMLKLKKDLEEKQN